VYWKRLLFRSSLIIGLLVLLILMLLPTGLRLGLVELLKRQGAEEALIENIDLNLLAGQAAIEGLHLRFPGAGAFKLGRLEVDLDMRALIDRRFIVESLTLDGLRGVIERDGRGRLTINGWSPDSLPASTGDRQSATTTPVFALESLQLRNLQLSYREPGFTQPLILRSLHFGPLDSRHRQRLSRLEFDLMLQQQSRLRGKLELTPLASDPRLQGKLQLTGLPLADYQQFIRQQLDRLSGTASVELDLDLTLPGRQAGALRGKSNQQLHIETLQLSRQNLEQHLESLDWNGRVLFETLERTTVQGDLKLAGSRSIDRQQNRVLAEFRQLDASGIELKPDLAVRLASLQLEGFRLLPDPRQPELARVEQLQVKGIRRQGDNELSITELLFSAPKLRIEIDEKRQLRDLSILQHSLDRLKPPIDESAPKPVSDQARGDSPPAGLEIGLIRLTSPGEIDFIDRSVNPHFKTRLLLEQLQIIGLSRSRPARFELRASQGDYNHFRIDGEGLLLAPGQKLKLKAVIEQLDLPPLTAYTSRATGYGVKSGVLDSDIDLSIDRQQLDATIKLELDAIDIIETDPETAAELNSAAGISIDLALSTLKDGDGRIRLEIPVKGDLEKPDFKLEKVINKALGKAMQGATLAYLKHTLQPFGSLITLYQLAKSASQRVALPAVEFRPGSTELVPGQQDLLEKVVRLMKERPGLKIKACGLAVARDREELVKAAGSGTTGRKAAAGSPAVPSEEALGQLLRELADQRSKWVKQQIVDSGIAPERVLNCLSQVRKEADTKPEVQLLL
jgi:hypothetical protein